jgi:lipoprotein-anchoring transpeptidase ErfK/SrfK
MLLVLVLITAFVLQLDTQTYLTTSVNHEVHLSSTAQHYAWWPDKETSGTITIHIDTSTQEVEVYRNGAIIGWAIVSTGKRGKKTPPGTYRILAKHELYRSASYAGTSMPYTQLLTDDGIAIHGGLVPNYPASHGCIRLPIEFAKLLYAVTDTETRVEIY